MSTDKRNSAIFINGGAGRVIASIPALEKFQEENPDNDFVIVCEGGTDFFKGHKSLYARVYDHWHKGLFQDKLKERELVTPEPYRVWEYYNQKCSIAQAYDIAINNKGTLVPNTVSPKTSLGYGQGTTVEARAVINEIKKQLKINVSLKRKIHIIALPQLTPLNVV